MRLFDFELLFTGHRRQGFVCLSYQIIDGFAFPDPVPSLTQASVCIALLRRIWGVVASLRLLGQYVCFAGRRPQIDERFPQ